MTSFIEFIPRKRKKNKMGIEKKRETKWETVPETETENADDDDDDTLHVQKKWQARKTKNKKIKTQGLLLEP
jgi:hypothetical protein